MTCTLNDTLRKNLEDEIWLSVELTFNSHWKLYEGSKTKTNIDGLLWRSLKIVRHHRQWHLRHRQTVMVVLWSVVVEVCGFLILRARRNSIRHTIRRLKSNPIIGNFVQFCFVHSYTDSVLSIVIVCYSICLCGPLDMFIYSCL